MEAWVTLATNDNYAVGALTLAQSLKRVKTSKNVVIMITEELSKNMREVLEEVFDKVFVVDPLDSKDIAHLTLLDRTELGITYTKLNCWTLIDYSKCVFLDADTLVIQNSDELFDREEFSAAPDAGWPDCFNSGVFVFCPSLETFKKLIQHAMTKGSFDGGDQGLLNTFFSDWATKDISRHIPFIYNMVATATYSYLPAYKFFGHNVKIVHFIGATKPWLVSFDEAGNAKLANTEKHSQLHLQLWWQIFNNLVRPQLNKQVSSSENTKLVCLETVTSADYMDTPPSPEKRLPPPPVDTRQNWESGTPDYLGSASFENILKKIDQTIKDRENQAK